MKQIFFNLVDSAFDNCITDNIECSWDEFKDVFPRHILCKNEHEKEQIRMIIPAYYKTLGDDFRPATNKDGIEKTDKRGALIVGRYKVNILFYSMLGCDFDGGITINDAKWLLRGYEYFAYTTFNHRQPKHKNVDKFRVLLPLLECVSYQEIEERKQNLIKMFKGVDKSTFDPCRGFFLPSCQYQDIMKAQLWSNSGAWFDLLSVEKDPARKVVNVKNITPMDDKTKEDIYQKILKIGVDEHADCRMIGWAMKSEGYDLEQFKNVCWARGARGRNVEKDCSKIWRDFKPGVFSGGTLMWYIRENGYPNYLKKRRI